MVSKKQGFTIVELLIVIVIVAILAAITIVAFNGVQKRADDSARKTENTQFKKLAEMRYVDFQDYVCTTCTTSTQIATSYKATGLIPAKANAYMWGDIYASPPVFDKKKLVVIHDNLNYLWISVSYWSNIDNLWFTTTYNSDGTKTTSSSATPMPPD